MEPHAAGHVPHLRTTRPRPCGGYHPAHPLGDTLLAPGVARGDRHRHEPYIVLPSRMARALLPGDRYREAQERASRSRAGDREAASEPAPGGTSAKRAASTRPHHGGAVAGVGEAPGGPGQSGTHTTAGLVLERSTRRLAVRRLGGARKRGQGDASAGRAEAGGACGARVGHRHSSPGGGHGAGSSHHAR